MTKENYGKLIEKLSPPSPVWKDCLNAFWVGGLICCMGQGLSNLYRSLGTGPEQIPFLVSSSLILLSALLTGLSLYDNIASFAGAGTLVPITGFANAVSSAALEYKTEGFILGVGAKMFTIAGPVIVYGTAASAVYGVIYWLLTM